ncbi:hypothetical protein D3C75_747110 [compost metagenome]
MRRRGYKPIPVLQPGGDAGLLQREELVCIGGLVRMSDTSRMHYLDKILNSDVNAKVHLLGMIKEEWFSPYSCAFQGDNTSWIPRSEWNRRKSIEEWLKLYGERWIPYQPRDLIQLTMF